MNSKITYGSDGWEIIIRNLWNKVKARNMDFRGVLNREVFVEHILGKEASIELSKKYDFNGNFGNLRITKASILIPDKNVKWELHDITATYSSLIETITYLMKSHNDILIRISAEHYYNNRIEESCLEIEEIELSLPKKSYISILNAVKSTKAPAEIGYIISDDQAEGIMTDFNLKLKCEGGDVIGERSALFIYEREVICIKKKRDDSWFVYHVGLSVCL